MNRDLRFFGSDSVNREVNISVSVDSETADLLRAGTLGAIAGIEAEIARLESKLGGLRRVVAAIDAEVRVDEKPCERDPLTEAEKLEAQRVGKAIAPKRTGRSGSTYPHKSIMRMISRGLVYKKIAEIVGCSEKTVHYVAQKYGATAQAKAQNMRDSGMKLRDIAEQLNVSMNWVWRFTKPKEGSLCP